jgi:hypothetical protein
MYDELNRQLADLLTDLSRAQERLLRLLAARRAALACGDTVTLRSLAADEEYLTRYLASCEARRAALWACATANGRQAESERALFGHGPAGEQADIRVRQSAASGRVAKSPSLAAWLLAQRRVAHLARSLEGVAATGSCPPSPAVSA